MPLPITPAIPNTLGVAASPTPSLETPAAAAPAAVPAVPAIGTLPAATIPSSEVAPLAAAAAVPAPAVPAIPAVPAAAAPAVPPVEGVPAVPAIPAIPAVPAVAPVEGVPAVPAIPAIPAVPAVPAVAPLAEIPAPASVETGYSLEIADDSPLDQVQLDAIAQYAADNSLDVNQANAIVASQESLINKGMSLNTEAQNAKHKAAVDTFNADPQFIGDARTESFAAIHRVTSAFGDAELTAALSDPNIGSSLPLARFLTNLGKAMGADPIEGSGTPPAPPAANTEEAKLRAQYPAFYNNI